MKRLVPVPLLVLAFLDPFSLTCLDPELNRVVDQLRETSSGLIEMIYYAMKHE
jgi:hypothetical protein